MLTFEAMQAEYSELYAQIPDDWTFVHDWLREKFNKASSIRGYYMVANDYLRTIINLKDTYAHT